MFLTQRSTFVHIFIRVVKVTYPEGVVEEYEGPQGDEHVVRVTHLVQGDVPRNDNEKVDVACAVDEAMATHTSKSATFAGIGPARAGWRALRRRC